MLLVKIPQAVSALGDLAPPYRHTAWSQNL